MPPLAGATCTPGTACKSGTSVSRQAWRWATTRGVISAVCCKAAMPARWVNTEMHEVLNSMSLPTGCVMAGGMTSQPRRQPVIKKLLEKLCTTTRRSSGVAMSRNDGAHPLAVSAP